MDLNLAPKKSSPPELSPRNIGRDSSGIALFMVISSVSVLAILVTEFTYIAQISQMIAYGGLDQAKAHYMAKSALKLSLLRLKAYSAVNGMIEKAGGPAASALGIPKSLIQKIWSFPFFYPIPTNIPGMSISDKSLIETFQKESGFDGKMSALIESESSKYNLNLLINPAPSASPSPKPTDSTAQNLNTPPIPTASPTFNPEEARASLSTYLGNIMTQKFETDVDFAANYRDFRLTDFMDILTSWVDRSYQRRTPPNQDKINMKRAPFYSVSEMHMLPMIDEELYDLFAPNLTASMTSGININTMAQGTLKAIVPLMSKDEITDFFKYRDSEESDNQFKGPDDFFNYLLKGVAAFKSNQPAIDKFKKDLMDRGIQLVTNETQFKITIRAEVNSAARTIEAWVALGPPSSQTSTNPANQNPPPGNPPPLVGPGTNPVTPDAGLRITFMRML